MYIDVHCHLDLLKDIDKRVSNAIEAGVEKIVANGVDPKTNRLVLEYSEKYKEVEAALGLYPIDALKLTKEEIDSEIEFIRSNKGKIVAIGEIGIDLKESKDLESQKETFVKLVKLSMTLDIPAIIHSRKAEEECIKILEELNAKRVVMHCFSGKKKLIKKIVENGWFLTVPTCVKRSEQFQGLVMEVPIEQLLCETDSPFLHPLGLPNNEPRNVVESYKKIAEIKNIEIEDLVEKIEKNYERLF